MGSQLYSRDSHLKDMTVRKNIYPLFFLFCLSLGAVNVSAEEKKKELTIEETLAYINKTLEQNPKHMKIDDNLSTLSKDIFSLSADGDITQITKETISQRQQDDFTNTEVKVANVHDLIVRIDGVMICIDDTDCVNYKSFDSRGYELKSFLNNHIFPNRSDEYLPVYKGLSKAFKHLIKAAQKHYPKEVL